MNTEDIERSSEEADDNEDDRDDHQDVDDKVLLDLQGPGRAEEEEDVGRWTRLRRQLEPLFIVARKTTPFLDGKDTLCSRIYAS